MRLFDEFLIDDFGIDSDMIELNYSGHRGYHVRVYDPNVFNLKSNGRVEIVHYITGVGFCSDKIITSRGNIQVVPERSMSGWAGKIADAIVEFIRNIDSYSGKERWVRYLQTNKTAAIEGFQRNPPIASSQVKGVGIKSWQEIAIKAVAKYGGKIDEPVTHDTHRVIRLIGSINGKTGFRLSCATGNGVRIV